MLIGLLRETVHECIEEEDFQKLKSVDTSGENEEEKSINDTTSMEDVPREISPVKTSEPARVLVRGIIFDIIQMAVLSSEAERIVQNNLLNEILKGSMLEY